MFVIFQRKWQRNVGNAWYRIRPHVDFQTASSIVTSFFHSKLDYCNSLWYKSYKFSYKQIQSSVKCIKIFTYFMILSLRRLKNIKIEYKLLSLPFNLRVFIIWSLFSPSQHLIIVCCHHIPTSYSYTILYENY